MNNAKSMTILQTFAYAVTMVLAAIYNAPLAVWKENVMLKQAFVIHAKQHGKVHFVMISVHLASVAAREPAASTPQGLEYAESKLLRGWSVWS